MRIKLKTSARFLASIFAGIGTKVRKDGLATYIDLDYDQFGEAPYDPVTQEVLIRSTLDGSFLRIKLAGIGSFLPCRVITAAGDVNIGSVDGLIILNKTVPENTTFFLPADGDKVGPVKIVDWAGIGATNTLQIVPNGTEKINGQSSWTLAGAYSSIVLSPTGQGLGYAA